MIFIKSRVRLIFLILITALILILPTLLRHSNGYITEEPYFLQRASILLQQGKVDFDELSYSGRPFTYSLAQPLVLLLFNKLSSKAILFLPILLGIVSLILLYFILKKLKVEPNIRDLTIILLLISPPFIYTFSNYNLYTTVIPFLLLIFLFFLQDKQFLKILAILLTFFIPFFGYQHSLIALALLLIYCIKERRKKEFSWILFLNIVSLSLIYLPYLVKYGFPEILKFKENILIYQALFSDLGSLFGLSIFVIFLLALGFTSLWKVKYKNLAIYLALLILIISLLFVSKFVIYLNILIAYLAALGFMYLSKLNWESLKIKKLTIWILVLGLIFSSFTVINNLANTSPSNNLLDGLENLKTLNEQTVFSHYSNGIFINAVAEKKNIMDGNFFYAPNLNERHTDSQTLFYTRDIELAQEIIKKYNIQYVFITKDMKSGLVWQKEDEGLLFLLASTKDKFKKLYDNGEVEIWRFRT